MKAKFILYSMLILQSAGLAYSQSFLGYSGSNYAGVHGLYSNPAQIAENRYAVDVNLVGVSFGFSNDFLELRNQGFLGSGTLTKAYDDFADFRQNALIVNFDGSETGQKANFIMDLDVAGPSALISLSPKDAIGIGVRYRAMVNFDDLGAEAARLALDEFVYPPLWGQDFESDGASLDMAVWIEYFASYGRTVWNTENHAIKAGASLKFLQGVVGMYMYSDDLNYNFTNDDILSIDQSSLLYGHTEGLEVDDLGNLSLNFDALGFGADLGVIYEWRPEGDSYSGRVRNDRVSRNDRSATHYKLRVGFSIMDLGGIRYNRDPDSYNRPAGSIDVVNWDLTQIDLDGLQSFDDTLNQRFPVSDEGQNSRFGMNLPTAINLMLDYHVYKGFYLGANGWISPKAKGNAEKVHGISRVTLNPRFETDWFEAGLPVSYQNFNGLDAGMYLRLGPVVFGSSDLISKAFADGLDGANVYLAFKIPILQSHDARSTGDDEYKQY
jgi:hypothetical protein